MKIRDTAAPAMGDQARRLALGRRCRIRLGLAAAFSVVSPATAQDSAMCQFAVAAAVTTEVELEEAKNAARACERRAGASCSAERARVGDLRHRLKLARDYLDRYCLR